VTDSPPFTAHPAEGDFRIGRVLERSFSVLSRNFLPFFVVTTVAYLPTLLVLNASAAGSAGAGQHLARSAALVFVGLLLMAVAGALSQAVVLYGAFQDLRGRPVSLAESVRVGLRRAGPIVALAIVMSLLGMLGLVLLIVPGMLLFTMWFVASSACVVERTGLRQSLRRSSQLTKGHRGKILGLMLLLFIVSAMVTLVIDTILSAVGGATLSLLGSLVWNGILGAFYAISAVVSYHDLRVAKEGIDIEHIAAVFD
jgi:hypothetical protein